MILSESVRAISLLVTTLTAAGTLSASTIAAESEVGVGAVGTYTAFGRARATRVPLLGALRTARFFGGHLNGRQRFNPVGPGLGEDNLVSDNHDPRRD